MAYSFNFENGKHMTAKLALISNGFSYCNAKVSEDHILHIHQCQCTNVQYFTNFRLGL